MNNLGALEMIILLCAAMITAQLVIIINVAVGIRENLGMIAIAMERRDAPEQHP